MDEEVIKFITSYIPLSEEKVSIIKEQNLIMSYKKGDVLLSDGEFSRECYFILKGCMRSYYLIDGEEKTTEFYTESQSIRPVSYLTGQPSEYYLSCLEGAFVLPWTNLSVTYATRLAHTFNAIVVGVDYREAPEHPFPIPNNDCFAALLWTIENIEKREGNPAQIIVAGEGAGAALATTVAIKAREAN